MGHICYKTWRKRNCRRKYGSQNGRRPKKIQGVRHQIRVPARAPHKSPTVIQGGRRSGPVGLVRGFLIFFLMASVLLTKATSTRARQMVSVFSGRPGTSGGWLADRWSHRKWVLVGFPFSFFLVSQREKGQEQELFSELWRDEL